MTKFRYVFTVLCTVVAVSFLLGSRAESAEQSPGFSVSFWTKFGPVGSAQALISEHTAVWNGFTITKGADDRIQMQAYVLIPDQSGADLSDNIVQSDFAPTPDLWYQIAATYSSKSGVVTLFANGTPLGSMHLMGSWSPAAGHALAANPAQMGGTTRTLRGTQCDFRYFARPLTEVEISKHYGADLRTFFPHRFAWANPVYFMGDGRGEDLHDPDIIEDNGVYYATCTLAPFGNYTDRDVSKPDYGSAPGMSLYASRDLKIWKFKSWIVKSSNLPINAPYKHQFWAPEIHKIHGRYFVIFGASNWIDDKYNIGGHMGYYQFVGVANKVTGPYRHFTALKGPGVDTSLFVDDDGKTYVIWPRNEIHPIDLSKIDQGIVTVGDKIATTATDNDYKAIGKPAPETMEGPYMIKHSGTYYSFWAETYRGPNGFYDTGIATAKSLSGPWTMDPRWRPIHGGHLSVFNGPGSKWWIAYKNESSDLGRPWLNIDPIEFDSHGTVHVKSTLGPQSMVLK